MSDSFPFDVPTGSAQEADKRRGSRLMVDIPVTVMGMDSLGEPFRETTTTTSISCYGCKYRTKRYTARHSPVTLEIRRPNSRSVRIVHARVVWVQRPKNHRETFQIGLELDVPGNVWGIDPPPEDWFPYPEDVRPAPAPILSTPAVHEIPAEPAEAKESTRDQNKEHAAVVSPISSTAHWETLALPEVPTASRTSATEASALAMQREVAAQAVKMTAEALVAEEVELLRKHFSGRLESALVETLKTFSDLTAEIVSQTHAACQASAKEMDAELRRVLEQSAEQMRALREAAMREGAAIEAAANALTKAAATNAAIAADTIEKAAAAATQAASAAESIATNSARPTMVSAGAHAEGAASAAHESPAPLSPIASPAVPFPAVPSAAIQAPAPQPASAPRKRQSKPRKKKEASQ